MTELAKAHYRIATLEESLQKLKEEGAIAPVEDRDVATVIELWTGIPAARIQENELSKLAHLEEVLEKKIIGQDEAVKAVSAAVRRSRVQISPPAPPGLLYLRGPHRHRQDRAGAGALPGAVRHPGDPDPPGYERVYGEALRVEDHRFAPGVRGLRRGRAADGEGAQKALLGAALRRDREGPTRTCSTSCCRFWTKGGSPTPTAAR